MSKRVYAYIRGNKINISDFMVDYYWSEKKQKFVIECCDNYGKYGIYADRLTINGVDAKK